MNTTLLNELYAMLRSEISDAAKILTIGAICAPVEPKITPSFAAKLGISPSTLSRHKNELDLEKISNLRKLWQEN